MELRIKEVLEKKNLKQKDLCDLMGRSTQYISNVVNGRGSISVPVLEEIAKALKVPVASLFADYVSEKKEEPKLSDTALCPHCHKPIKLTL
ncbi:MAG: helix-turn-helix transcriptional regulator [Bacteroides thetaiotaomicron]|uniref:Helix-turn-helix transcriptional regulator n=1 Tax=Bacteroides thetaiotaomicron TaxID=818 RepID=A0A943DQ90_BACT4|nr:helix-turn-helix transcriptional regulator [Bacteroides thetaiotaomicron]